MRRVVQKKAESIKRDKAPRLENGRIGLYNQLPAPWLRRVQRRGVRPRILERHRRVTVAESYSGIVAFHPRINLAYQLSFLGFIVRYSDV
jgi:hypothetical protein